MLVIEIEENEMFDEATDRFIKVKPQIVKLEHSLVSISKWESIWKKPFLGDSKKTKKELLSYIECMIVGQIKDPNIVSDLAINYINEIIEYINSPMTATTVTFSEDIKPRKKEIITSELIYYWMIASGIPFECEKWHLNRLLTLIKVCSAKNQNANKKMNPKKSAQNRSKLNAERRARLKSKG